LKLAPDARCLTEVGPLLSYPHRGAVRETHVQDRRDLPNLYVGADMWVPSAAQRCGRRGRVEPASGPGLLVRRERSGPGRQPKCAGVGQEGGGVGASLGGVGERAVPKLV
jgi:hypothetical protein